MKILQERKIIYRERFSFRLFICVNLYGHYQIYLPQTNLKSSVIKVSYHKVTALNGKEVIKNTFY